MQKNEIRFTAFILHTHILTDPHTPHFQVQTAFIIKLQWLTPPNCFPYSFYSPSPCFIFYLSIFVTHNKIAAIIILRNIITLKR